MSNEAALMEIDESPYVGGAESFDDELSPEEQAIHDQEMAGELDESPETPPPAAEEQEEFVPDEQVVEDPPTITDEDKAAVEAENVPHGTGEASTTVENSEAAAPADPPPTPRATEPTIPKTRLDREITKRRALEQELATLKAAKKVEAVEDTPISLEGAVDMEAITKALDMNLDGKNSDAAAILVEQLTNAVQTGVEAGRSQMRELVNANREQAVADAVGTIKKETANSELDVAIDTVEETYPVFDPAHESFDADLIERANNMRRALEADGVPAAEALKEAADLTILRHRPDLVQDKIDAAKQQAGEQRAEEQAQTATQTARARNAAAAQQQPPQGRGVPNAEERGGIDLDSLSEEEFDALPESTLAELRGDIV